MNYCDIMYDVLAVWLIGILPMLTIYGVYFWRKLPPIFDPILFNEKYWHPNEEFLPFYKFRRASVYAMCIGLSKRGRVKFAPYDLTHYVSKRVKHHCIFFAWMLLLSIAIPFATLIPGRTVCRPAQKTSMDYKTNRHNQWSVHVLILGSVGRL